MSAVAFFPAVELAPGAARAEAGLGERSGQSEGSLAVEIVVALAQGAEDSQSALAGDDLAPGAAFGSVGPGAVLLAQLEEVRNHPDHVTPVIGIVGLDHQKTRGQKSTVDVGQESRRDDPAMSLAGVVIGLGMVEVDLGDRGLGDVGGNESSGVLDNEPDIVEPTLVGSARGVADDHGQFVDCPVVVIRPGKRIAESEPPVAATKVKNDRRLAVEERCPVERTRLGQPLDPRPRPVGLGQNQSGDRHAELVFDLAGLHGAFALEPGRWCKSRMFPCRRQHGYFIVKHSVPSVPVSAGPLPDGELTRKGVAAMTKSSIMSDLMSVIADRNRDPQAEKSYVASLMKGGVSRIGEKVIEEAAEVVEAGHEPGDPGREHLVKEVADLVFHAMVLLGYRDLHWDDVEAELGRRSGISGIAEKAARQSRAE